MTPKDSVNISDFDYPLPDERIARFPADERDASRLLVYRRGALSETRFRGIGGELPEGAVLVFNNTKVIRARIVMHKPSGARVEVFCLEPHAPADYERAFAAQGECRWQCIVGNLKKWKEGPLAIDFDCNGVPCRVQAWREGTAGTSQVVRFTWDAALSFGQLLEHLGRIPIPPYLGRDSEEIDNTRYQTVYSRFEGSVAAPTAGLHFTPELIERLRREGVRTEEVTLHVGAGTFLPVKTDNPLQHTMHTEHFEVTAATVRRLAAAAAGRHIVAVGTTSVRTLESLPVLGWRILREGNPHTDTPVGQWEAYDLPAEADGAARHARLVHGGHRHRKAAGRHADYDNARFHLPADFGYDNQFSPAKKHAAAAGIGIHRRRVATPLRLRPLARFPFPQLRRQFAAAPVNLPET